MADDGNRRAAAALKLTENYDRLLSSVLVGNNIVNITATSVATVLFIKAFGQGKGPTASTIIMTVIVLIFGEVTPKSVAKESPEKVCNVCNADIESHIFHINTFCCFLRTLEKAAQQNVQIPE